MKIECVKCGRVYDTEDEVATLLAEMGLDFECIFCEIENASA